MSGIVLTLVSVVSSIYEKVKHMRLSDLLCDCFAQNSHEGCSGAASLAAAVTSRGSTTLMSLLPNLSPRHGDFGVHFMVSGDSTDREHGPRQGLQRQPRP